MTTDNKMPIVITRELENGKKRLLKPSQIVAIIAPIVSNKYCYNKVSVPGEDKGWYKVYEIIKEPHGDVTDDFKLVKIPAIEIFDYVNGIIAANCDGCGYKPKIIKDVIKLLRVEKGVKYE